MPWIAAVLCGAGGQPRAGRFPGRRNAAPLPSHRPIAYALREVSVISGIENVAITRGTDVIARHHWGKDHTTFAPLHYLALLKRKPGAIDFARPLESWELTGSASKPAHGLAK